MKKLVLTTVIFVSLLFISIGIQAQTAQPKLDQLRLVQAIVGTWQGNISKDTVEVWDCQQHGKALVENAYIIINGKKTFSWIDSYFFSSKEGKFKGFALYPSGVYYTWLGSFTSDKKMAGDFVQDFNPTAVTGKFELVIETPTSITYTVLDSKGIKTNEFKYTKTK